MTIQKKIHQTKNKKKSDFNNKIVFRPHKSVLLVIDMQQYFCNPLSHAYFKASTKIVPNIFRLISIYRQKSLPVIFTKYALLRTESPGAMGRWWKDVLYDDESFSSIINKFHPLPDEPVIRKTQYSAFYKTNLKKILNNFKITNILITGVLTHLCCETTARDAFMRNYDVFFVADATASDEKDFHEASIRNLSDGFATIVTTDEVISWLEKKSNNHWFWPCWFICRDLSSKSGFEPNNIRER